MPVEAAIARHIDRIFERLLSEPPIEFFAQSGSFLVRSVFASDELADRFRPSFIPALPATPDLTLAVLTGGQANLSDLVPRPRDAYRFFAGERGYVIWQPGPPPPAVLSLFDRDSNRAVIWLPEGHAPVWVYSRPAIGIMHARSLHTPWVGLHAGAIGRNGEVLLIAGKGRAGKTTTTLACAQAGWDYAGDDFVATSSSDGRVEPLYSSARLRLDMAGHFPEYVKRSRATSEIFGDVRYEVPLSEALPPQQFKGGKLKAILLPRRRGAMKIEFEPARRFDAMSALFSVSADQQPGWPNEVASKDRRDNRACADILRRYRSDTAPNPSRVRPISKGAVNLEDAGNQRDHTGAQRRAIYRRGNSLGAPTARRDG